MTNFFISDTHIGHANILHLGRGRPFGSLEHMASSMRNSWFEAIQPEDTVYVMGDIAMGNFEQSIEWFRDLPGDKLLIPGNHDKVGGTQSASRIERFGPIYKDVGFTILEDIVTIEMETSYGTQKVLLSHYPYGERHHDDGSERFDKYAKHRPKNEGLPLLHGHTHSSDILQEEYPLQYHIGVDAQGFAPVHESKVVEWLESLKAAGTI